MDKTYVAHPIERACLGTVILAMHIWGVDEPMRSAAARFAAAGYATIVPDLYRGMGAPDGEGATDHAPFLPFARSLNTEGIDEALSQAREQMRACYPHARCAIAGFCMGGLMASLRSTDDRRFAAAALWYGLSPDVDPASVVIPVVGSFAALDRGIPAERVDAFTQRLSVPSDVRIYEDAQHGFCDEQRAAFHREASDDSWRRTIAFFDRHLSATMDI